MTIDKKKRRANYQAITVALDRNYNRSPQVDYRKWYVDGVRPGEDRLTRRKLDDRLFSKLVCEPDADEAVWREWKEKNPVDRKSLDRVRFLGVQSTKELYFGTNSVFAERESEIWDFFFSEWSESGLPEPGIPDNSANYVSGIYDYYLGKTITWVSESSRNPHSQIWRLAYMFEVTVKSGRLLNYRPATDDVPADVVKMMCRVEAAHRHPEKFAPEIAPVIDCLHRSLTNREMCPGTTDLYEHVVSENMAQFMRDSAAGGSYSLCVRYASAAVLEAALPLLNPKTRYPYGPDVPDDKVLAIPFVDHRATRTSVRLMTAMWKCGFVPDTVERLDDRTLFIHVSVPLDSVPVCLSLMLLCWDMTNFVERVKSSKDIWEEDYYIEKPAPAVLLTQPLEGDWCVGAVGALQESGEVHRGEDSAVDQIVESGSVPKEFLPKLLDGHIDRIRKSTKRWENSDVPW